VSEVAELLDQNRLVTVTGPGGVGKTRLAGEVAKHVAGRFADGVQLAELAALDDPELVAPAVAAALGIPGLPARVPADALAQALAGRHLLLVLDNCEHVIDAAAALCAGLLGADAVWVLATSREPLRIAGEARYRLGPLTLPDPDDPADASGSEAVALFADRARRTDAGFALDAETGSVVARLVTRLDGLPLAIELAAARVEALGVAQLLDRIDDRFGLLVTGDRLAAGRQRSLAATVEWSYQLLDDHERRVFRAVSVFPGSFTLEGAEAVAGADAGPAVLRLVDCSLVVPPRVGPDGRSRYLMLETLRSYGARLLAEAGESDEAAAALAGFALDVAEDAVAGAETGTWEVAGIRHLGAEESTTRHGLAWGIEHDADMLLRLAVALAWRWQLRDRMVDQFAEAVTVWAALTALWGYAGFPVPPDNAPLTYSEFLHPDAPRNASRRQELPRAARQVLEQDATQAAEERGAAMSLAGAAEYARMLAAADPRPAVAARGPGKLSAREQELITLVAQGRTDAQIAAQLYISVRTVSSHLDRIRDKTGCRRRADLTRLALSAGLL
jgi:predicted ATPase/DNA-binding CsgD family transcriptional regulator